MNKIYKLFEGELLVYSKIFRRSRKSQPVPTNNSGPVKIVVGDTFDELVTNSGRDALLDIYRQRCRYCVRLEPILNALAAAMKNEEIDILKIDGRANDYPPPYAVHGFPTIWMKFADSKKTPQEYIGSRTADLQTLIRYVAKHASKELKGWDRNGKPKKLLVH